MTARITVTGNAATAPLVRITAGGRKVTNFRIGSTERRQDRETGDWVDGNSFFVSVACWNALADNVERSVRVGTPLVVTGKISQRTYTDAQDKVQYAYEIQAETVAPDLNRGIADFSRVNRTTGPSVAVDEGGMPPVGVARAEFEPHGSPVARAGEGVAVLRDGAFGYSSETEPACDEDVDGGSHTDERDASELVGANA